VRSINLSLSSAFDFIGWVDFGTLCFSFHCPWVSIPFLCELFDPLVECIIYMHILLSYVNFQFSFCCTFLVLYYCSWRKNAWFDFSPFTCIKTRCLTHDLFLENVLWGLEKKVYPAGDDFSALYSRLDWLDYHVGQVLCFPMDLRYGMLKFLLHLVLLHIFWGYSYIWRYYDKNCHILVNCDI
jgi:hypothetical protein